MIAYLKGEIASVSEDNVVVEVGNIGYNVRISTGLAAALPAVGSSIKIYTYTYVKEDAFLLYGFGSQDELELFKRMITVNGIGPKGALSILSVMSAADLRFAIYTGDAKAIAKAPGIGAKTAERLIIDLKDKVSIQDGLADITRENFSAPAGGAAGQIKSDAAEALTALGYGATEAWKAVNRIEITEDTDVEQVLKLALKFMV